MSSYVKRKNCCFLKKSKKYLESIRQNSNQMLDVINELTIKGEFCELKGGDIGRLLDMRCILRDVLKGWAKHTCDKLSSEVKVYTCIEVNFKSLVNVGDKITIKPNSSAWGLHDDKEYTLTVVKSVGTDNWILQEDWCSENKLSVDFVQTYINNDIKDSNGPEADVHKYGTSVSAISGSGGFTITKICSCKDSALHFDVHLHMVGSELQSKTIPMYSLKDTVSHAFATGDERQFTEEYLNNPDILIEDISEFLQAIDKLERLIKKLSDDNKRDSDTEFCCKGEPPKRGPSCQ